MSSDKDHMRVYMAKRYERRKSEAIASLGGQCVICGSKEDLQFHHVDPESKSFTIGTKLASIAQSKLDEELSKCELRCEKCHTEHHAVGKRTHGTLSSYKYCKCELCRAAKARSNSEQYQRASMMKLVS